MRSCHHAVQSGFSLALALCSAMIFTPALIAQEKDPRVGTVSVKQWEMASQKPLTSSEIDQLISRYLQKGEVKATGRTTDEQFIRRVYLDLTGNLPYPADVTEFKANKDGAKRGKLIDKLLQTREHAQHWARYWRAVITARVLDRRGEALGNSFEVWMTEQLRKNTSWAEITTSMLTARGEARYADNGSNGAAFFLASHFGNDAVVEQAAETARLFLGIQINCAQCHDHPSDVWKREQFHQLAAYFVRSRQRPLRDDNRRIVGLELISVDRRFNEYRMPGTDNPRERTVVHPKTLDGTSPRRFLPDRQRRASLAEWVVDKKNPWFAAAFVNRLWSELVGQPFYQAVDDLGPAKEAIFPGVITRLAGGFKGSDYNIRELFHVIMNSETYQRQTRLGDAPSEHLQFAAAYPTRLKADTLWNSVEHVLGKMTNRFQPRRGGIYARRFGPEAQFKEEFKFDPSLRSEDVEGSIPQALILMNNSQINQRISAVGRNLLGRILTAYSDNSEALQMVYLRALARMPSEKEKDKCLTYLRKVGNRKEAFEDILWALINSTEFQTKR